MYWVKQDETRRLAIAPRPRGDDWLRDELLLYRSQGIEHLVSTLTRWEIPDLGLSAEDQTCERCGLKLHRFSIEDQGVPDSMLAAHAFLSPLLAFAQQGKGVAFHGRSGMGRAPLLLGALLVMDDWRTDDVWPALSDARQARVPETDDQRAWLFDFADMLLAMRGSL
jgi:protein-tyrosine phosphatase